MKRYIKSDIDYTRSWEDMSNMQKKEFAWEYLLTLKDEDALNLVTEINGDSYNTYCDILYAITGERDFESVWEDVSNI